MGDKVLTKATVIIPTTGSPSLERAIQSVLAQSYQDLECWVIIDGTQFASAARTITAKYDRIKVLELLDNTGANNFYGHRIYAAAGYLINSDYILYLDQDNWMDPGHIESMITTIETRNLDWCYSLRKIYDKNGTFVADDNCESLGKWPAWVGDQVFLVDTSCYCIKREVIVRISGAWYAQWGGDRVFYANLSHHFTNFGCTGKHSINYGLDGNPGSVTADFFFQGNSVMKSKYPTLFPWQSTT
jgi:glycosyltransferase involved in cell wall biosynthesis